MKVCTISSTIPLLPPSPPPPSIPAAASSAATTTTQRRTRPPPPAAAAPLATRTAARPAQTPAHGSHLAAAAVPPAPAGSTPAPRSGRRCGGAVPRSLARRAWPPPAPATCRVICVDVCECSGNVADMMQVDAKLLKRREGNTQSTRPVQARTSAAPSGPPPPGAPARCAARGGSAGPVHVCAGR